MAPATSLKGQDFSNRPLADYFWIAGLDTQDILDAYPAITEKRESVAFPQSPLSTAFDGTIAEDAAAEEEADSIVNTPSVSTKHSRQSSYQKLSRLSSEARSSIQSIDRLTHLSSVRSNGSNATIRRVVSSSQPSSLPPSPGLLQPIDPNVSRRRSALLSDADFDKVLTRFTTDRDAFYLDLNFKSDAVQPKPSRSIPQPRPRTQRIIAEDLEPAPGLNRGLGSVRRHMSFKDMNSTKRQHSIARRLSTRSARRVSSYNSVMPMPRPLQPSPTEHPLKRSYEPVLLDRYPRRTMHEELKRRDQFPDYVPMFAFPNDIHIISSDNRPATKWHEFYLTQADNKKIPAVCIVVWVPLEQKVADALERHCEDWRKAHMSEAERELAASLGERLAAERAKLSRLLAQLPQMLSGTGERDDLENEIGVVEEKISLMSDMLRPLRHGAANRIEGLTDSDNGLWAPRAYGILGRDQSMVCFWKEWLKAVVVPMLDGAVLGVPPTSPRVGMWQPLERYVNIICTQALQPLTSRIQVEVFVRELRLYAKKEARNEIPGSRTTDLYPLFRCLTIPNVIILFEYLLAEARIILVSSYTSILKLASNALLALLWPLDWSGVHIPVLPTRLMEVLEAPIPYICGVVRKNDNLILPQDDDFVMVDLDKNELYATSAPPPLPKQQKRKLTNTLYRAAPHQQARGVSTGPPAYAYEAYPNGRFVSEHRGVFSAVTPASDLGKLASQSSAQFSSSAGAHLNGWQPLLNAFAQAKPASSRGIEGPRTSSTARRPSQTEGSDSISPITSSFPPLPTTPQSRNDSGFALQASLKEKRSINFRNSDAPSLSNVRRKPSLPFVKHNSTLSRTSEIPTLANASTYAPSTYAQSTLAASTVMPGMSYQPVRNTITESWQEGHCMQWRSNLAGLVCAVCTEKADEGLFKCADCPLQSHVRCLAQICVPCQAAFSPDQVRIAFARFFASLFYNYRRFMVPADATQKKLGLREKFNVDAWIRNLPPDHADYMIMMKETQAFDEFIHERESKGLTQSDSIALFDAVMAAKKARTKGVRSSIVVSLSGRNPFAGRSQSGGVPAEYLSDTSTHTWKVISTPQTAEKADLSAGARGREYREIINRTPAKLEDDLFQAAPPVPPLPVPEKKSLRHRMNGLSMHAP